MAIPRAMSLMMCAQRLWRRVRPWTESSKATQHQAAARLSDWAATAFTEDGDDLVIAMEVRTYLTVVFRYAGKDTFQDGFRRALTDVLEDLVVGPELRESELAAAVPICLRSLRDAPRREALRTAEFMCGVERSHHDDLRTVQLNLNKPHGLPPHDVPVKAVRDLFGRPPRRPA